jgi:hypothetical protein
MTKYYYLSKTSPCFIYPNPPDYALIETDRDGYLKKAEDYEEIKGKDILEYEPALTCVRINEDLIKALLAEKYLPRDICLWGPNGFKEYSLFESLMYGRFENVQYTMGYLAFLISLNTRGAEKLLSYINEAYGAHGGGNIYIFKSKHKKDTKII